MKTDDIKVHFVGAGPGAIDLITVRGMRLLENADVVIYAGSLVNRELLTYAKKATVYNSATMTLDEVIEVIEKAVSGGKVVVRLHTGDQSIYGAVREQMDELEKRKIQYDSCPGVSACFGAAAAMNVEYTLPGVSQSLIITRMEGTTKVPESERLEELAKHHTSMAIYLSSALMDKVTDSLIKAGYSEDTPAAVCYRVTWPDEKIIRCTIGTLYESARKHGIYKTAIILIGDAIDRCDYELSRLYAPDFSTEYRSARIEE